MELTYAFTIKEIPADAERVLAWIPVPPSNAHQTLHSFRVHGERPYTIGIEPEYGNRFLRFDLSDVARQDGEEPTVTVTFHVTRERYGQSATTRELDPVDKKMLARFLAADRLIPIDGKIAEEAKRVAGDETEPLPRARLLYDNVVATLDYDKSGTGWGLGDAVYACDVRKGNCTDFHSLFIGQARALEIPARFIMGFPLPEDAKEGVIKGYHCWAEFYVEGRGWLPIDASEASRDPEKKETFFGGLDENRIEFTRGRDVNVPGAKASALNYVVYPHVEVDRVLHDKVNTSFYFREAGPEPADEEN